MGVHARGLRDRGRLGIVDRINELRFRPRVCPVHLGQSPGLDTST